MGTSNPLATVPYRERLKLLDQRLRDVRYPTIKPLPKPTKVQAAERVVAEWEAKNEAHIQAQRDAHKAKMNRIKDEVILGNAEEAVRLLRELDAEASKK